MRAYAEPCQVHLTVCSYLAWLIIPHIVMTSVMLCTAPASQGTPGGCCDGPTHANWQKKPTCTNFTNWKKPSGQISSMVTPLDSGAIFCPNLPGATSSIHQWAGAHFVNWQTHLDPFHFGNPQTNQTPFSKFVKRQAPHWGLFCLKISKFAGAHFVNYQNLLGPTHYISQLINKQKHCSISIATNKCVPICSPLQCWILCFTIIFTRMHQQGPVLHLWAVCYWVQAVYHPKADQVSGLSEHMSAQSCIWPNKDRHSIGTTL